MKKEFSKKWKASKQPRKQRKYIANAPLSIKKKMVSANLSKELREKYGKRNVPLKKDDTVVVMRGKFKKHKGKIMEIDLKLSKVVVEGVQAKKQDGSKVNVKLQPSNLRIVELNLNDKKRSTKLGVKKEAPKKETKTAENKK